MKYAILLLLSFISTAYSETQIITLGNQKVQLIKIHGHGKTLIHLHENEATALLAAKKFIAKQGGSLIRLKHGGTRNIRFKLRHKYYEFDPNRIFTDQGIKKTLQNFGSYSIAAHLEVKKLARAIIKLLPDDKVIAVHNNQHYSLKEYFPHRQLSANVHSIYFKPHSSSRNFYLVTSKRDYLRLKNIGFNVVLQKSAALNDGSLSYFLANKKYINIETAYKKLSTQLKMLDYA